MTGYTFSQLIDFTRTSAGTFVNSSGNIASTAQSRNLLTFTQEFSNAAWVKSSATVAANSIADPNGMMTADTLTASGANGTVLQTFTASAVPYTFSIWLRRLTGTGNVQLTVDGTTFVTVAVTSDWTRFSTTLTPSAGSRTAGVRIVTSGDAVYGWGAQLEAASTATDYTRNVGGLFPPRFDYDPVTLAPKGLLVEEQRTNLMVRSEEFDNASFTKVGATATANTTASPDGTVDADSLLATGGNTQHYLNQSHSFTSGTTYTLSVFAKKNTLNGVQLTFGSGAFGTLPYANFDLNAGTSFTSNCTATLTNFGNGWYRCTMTATANGTTSAGAVISLARDTTESRLPTFDSDGNGIFLYGAQLEAGAFATSYIPTVASQVTRSRDDAAIQAPNFASWYNPNEGTLVVEADSIVNVSTSVYVSFAVNNGTVNEQTRMFLYNGRWAASVKASAVDQCDLQVTSSYTPGVPAKSAFAYKTNDFALSVNGSAVLTDTSGSLPTGVNQALFGAPLNIPINGHLRSLRYYPTRLTNAQLQALTA